MTRTIVVVALAVVGIQARADVIDDINANECKEELRTIKHIRSIQPPNPNAYGPDGNRLHGEYLDNRDRAADAHRECIRKAQEARKEVEYERRRAERSDREAEKERRAEATRKDRKAMAAIFGAQFCLYGQVRRDAMKEIAAEKKYARIGGVESRTKLYNLQQKIRWADEHEADERADMRRTFRGMTPLPCSRIEVLKILACVADECVDDETRHRASFITTEDSDDE